MTKKNNMLIILDGYGIGKEYPGNAIYLANKPNIDWLSSNYPQSKISASGLDVGLPPGQMGNSEVGHLNIGAGRIIYQTLYKINNSVQDGTMFTNPVLREAINRAKNAGTTLHLMGVLSDGGVHSHEAHLYALLKMAKDMGAEDVAIHIILDGRDVSPNAGIESIRMLEEKMEEIGIGRIATVSGRYYTMDRDNNWQRTKLAYDTIVKAEGERIFDLNSYVSTSYDENVTDEFMLPRVVGDYQGMKDGDSVIFFNFRPDRARQITRAIVTDVFDGFERPEKVNTFFVTFTEYDKSIENVQVAFRDEPPKNTIGELVSSKGFSQLRIAETEKYAHVTFFLNGGIETLFEGEDRILVPSPKVATFDLMPQMSAIEVTDKVVEAIHSLKYEMIVLNFANPDMVGHTGNIPAAIKAVETVDESLGRVLKALEETNGTAIVTADHGNVEMMLGDDNEVITAHTTDLVPVYLYNFDEGVTLKDGGRLCDLAPTLLDIIGIEQPAEMTGFSLLERGV